MPDGGVSGYSSGIGWGIFSMSDDTQVLLGQISALTKIVRNTWLVLLLACAFGWLFIATVSDADKLTDEAAINLPIVGQSVTPSAFQIATPFVLTLVMVYLHVMIARLWRLYARLPEGRIDGLPIEERVEPWLGTALLRTDQDPRMLVWIGRLAAVVFVWLVPAVTILAVGGSYVVAGEWQQAYHTLVFLVVAFSTVTYLVYASVPMEWLRSGMQRMMSVWMATTFAVAVFGLVLYGATGSPLRWPDLTTWANRSVDLTGEDLRKFEIKMDGAKLPDAKFADARFKTLRLTGAEAQGADFHSTKFGNAQLYETDFSDSTFWYTDFRNALLANFFAPQKHHTNFSGAFLLKSKLGNASVKTNSSNGIDFSGALISGTHFSDEVATAMGLENGYSRLNDSGIDDLYLSSTSSEASSRFATMSTSMIFDGAALRFFDPRNLWTVDVTTAFADGTVPHPEQLDYDPVTGNYNNPKRPCHWSTVILNDEEFFAGWRWWREENNLPWPPSDTIGDHRINRVRIYIPDETQPSDENSISMVEYSGKRTAYQVMTGPFDTVSVIPLSPILVRDIEAKEPYGHTCRE